MDLSTSELSLLVIAGLAAGTYAKSEGANSVLGAVVGAGTAVLVFLLTN